MGNQNLFPAPGAGGEQAGADHIRPLLQRLRLNRLLQRFPPRLVRALYVFVNSFLTIGALALLALVSRNPFVFPSLGPTAYLLFFSPLSKASSPRNTILGHAIGLICGYAAFVATGAGAIGNRTIGTASAGGMFIGTVMGVMVIPGVYYLFAKFSDGRKLLGDEVDEPLSELLEHEKPQPHVVAHG